MAKSQIINQVIGKFHKHNSVPSISQLIYGGERVDNGIEVNGSFYLVAKEASGKVTKDLYTFNFSPDSLVKYKGMGCQKDVFFALRCANDDRFCTLSLDDVLTLQATRNGSQGFDEKNQLRINVEIKNKRTFEASVSGGGKRNPVGKMKKTTGLFSSEISKLL